MIIKPIVISTRSFVSNAQIIVPLILQHVSENSDQPIAISKSLFAEQQLIAPIQLAGENCISISDLLALLDNRLLQEEMYNMEIIQLRNEICEGFNKFYQGITDKELMKFIRNQRQRIIDVIFDSLKFEKIKFIGVFYDNMLNGFHDDSLNKLYKVIYYALWKPLLTPFPLKLVNTIIVAMGEINDLKDEQKIEEATSKIILFAREHLIIENQVTIQMLMMQKAFFNNLVMTEELVL